MNNGKEAEDKFMELYPHVDFINGIIDFCFHDKCYVEVKSCQKIISSGNAKYPYRKGRFTLYTDQHDELCSVNGLYCFFLFDIENDLENKLIAMRFVPAKTLRFQQKISWNKIIGGE